MVVVLLCGCQTVFGVHHVDPAPVDASMIDSPIPGLVAYYPMDDLGPATACMTDALGGPSGRCNNGIPALVSTIHGSGYQFDGTAYITVPSTPAMQTPPFTVTVWISLLSPQATIDQCPASRVYGAAHENSWQFCVSSGQVFYGGGNGEFYADGTSITVGTWHQLAMTFDGTAIQGFLDGRALMTTPATIFLDAQPIVVGLDLDSGVPSYPFPHVVDELAIYDRALTPTELAQLYQM